MRFAMIRCLLLWLACLPSSSEAGADKVVAGQIRDGWASGWAKKKVIGLSKYLGVSIDGFEEEADRLFGAIECRWSLSRKVKNHVASVD